MCWWSRPFSARGKQTECQESRAGQHQIGLCIILGRLESTRIIWESIDDPKCKHKVELGVKHAHSLEKEVMWTIGDLRRASRQIWASTTMLAVNRHHESIIDWIVIRQTSFRFSTSQKTCIAKVRDCSFQNIWEGRFLRHSSAHLLKSRTCKHVAYVLNKQ